MLARSVVRALARPSSWRPRPSILGAARHQLHQWAGLPSISSMQHHEQQHQQQPQWCRRRGLSDFTGAKTPSSLKDLHYDMALASTLFQWERVCELFELSKGSEADSPLQPDATVYDLGIAAYSHVGQWELALEMLEEMWDKGMNPAQATYNSVVDVVQLAGKWEKVMEVLEHIKNRGEEPGPLTYKAAMLGTAQAVPPQWEALLKIFADFRGGSTPPDTQAVNIALVACLRVGDWQQGLQIASELGTQGDKDTLMLVEKLRAKKEHAQADAAASESK